MPLTPGTTLGPYEIQAPLGAGSSLNHPHICTLHDIGSQDRAWTATLSPQLESKGAPCEK